MPGGLLGFQTSVLQRSGKIEDRLKKRLEKRLEVSKQVVPNALSDVACSIHARMAAFEWFLDIAL